MRPALSHLTLGFTAPFFVAGCAAIYHLDEYSTADVQPDAQARTPLDGGTAAPEADARSDVAARAANFVGHGEPLKRLERLARAEDQKKK